MENFKVDSIGRYSLVFLSGGDWQEMVPVTLRLKRDSHILVWSSFDSYTRKSGPEIELGRKDLINYVRYHYQEYGKVLGDY